jgi:hypothetical protein
VAYLFEDFGPDVVGPMGGDWCEYKGLVLDVFGYQVFVHANASSTSGLLAVKVSGACKVV